MLPYPAPGGSPEASEDGVLGLFPGHSIQLVRDHICFPARCPGGVTADVSLQTHLQMGKLRPGAWEASAGLGPLSCSCLVFPRHPLTAGKAETPCAPLGRRPYHGSKARGHKTGKKLPAKGRDCKDRIR